jgi:hypothetical protein
VSGSFEALVAAEAVQVLVNNVRAERSSKFFTFKAEPFESLERLGEFMRMHFEAILTSCYSTSGVFTSVLAAFKHSLQQKPYKS